MSNNNPIVGADYKKLVKAMLDCAENDDLPQALEIRDTSRLTLEGVHELITEFTGDTGLSMKFSAEVCPNCDKLHAFLFVDYPEEDNEITLLQ